MNAASSVFQSSTFGFAGILPQNYTSAVMSGQVGQTPVSGWYMSVGHWQAVAGVFAALASILSLLVTSTIHEGQPTPQTTKDSAYIYFGIACFVLILCLASVFLLSRMVS